MLEEVMRYVNNRFDRDPRGVAYGSASGAFEVVDGTMSVEGLKDGQWFWVEGSTLNDGLHLYPDTDMRDEEFEGTVTFLVVPRSFEDLCAEVAQWVEDNAEAISTPYASESFGGYSYAKATAAQQASQGNAQSAWQLQFGARLRPFRKLSRDWL